MLHVLTLSTLFPTAARPTFGIFVERQTLELAERRDVELRVVAPVGLPPWPLSLHPHYAERLRLPKREIWKNMVVDRPRYRALPFVAQARAARVMARAVLPLLREVQETLPFEIIDAEFFWPDGVAAMHLGRALGIPFSVKARGSDIHYWGKLPAVAAQLKTASLEAAGLIAVSEALRRDMIALGMPAERIVVHHGGVDLDVFRPLDRRAAKAALGVQGPLLISVGALIPLKGQSLAIAALDHIPDATLFLAGEGPERAALERQAAPYGSRVRLLGNRPHGELPALMAAADVMVLPSEREGLAIAWIEALACGTPIVVPDVGGAGEVVDRPAAGRLAAREPRAIAEAVKSLLADPPAPEGVREAAERFSWQRNKTELFDYLSGLTPAASGPRRSNVPHP
jgi:teichuronic acid biosynthesis glycosyltransferase TuaC